jgi:hypothetical protein
MNKETESINKPFKEILDNTITATVSENVIKCVYIDHAEEVKLKLLWQDQIHKNIIKTKKGW